MLDQAKIEQLCVDSYLQEAFNDIKANNNESSIALKLKNSIIKQQITKSDTPLALFLMSYALYQEQDYSTCEMISSCLVSDHPHLNIEIQWLLIRSLQKLNLLKELQEQLEKFPMKDIAKRKLTYVTDFLENKLAKLVQMTTKHKTNLGQKVYELVQQAEDQSYFKQYGFPAYLIEAEWMQRWKILTGYHLIANEEPGALFPNQMHEEQIINILIQLNPQMKDKLNQIRERQYNQADLLLCPIWNDELMDFTKIQQDSLSFKQYTNYRLKEGLRENQDYFLLSGPVWKILHDNFGGIDAKRIIINRGDKPVVDIQMKLIRYQIKAEIHAIQLNHTETTDELIKKIKRIEQIEVYKLYRSSEDQKHKRNHVQGQLDNCQIAADDVLIIESQLNVEKCRSCKEIGKLYFCECLSVQYCDKQCQLKDRKDHQDDCRKILYKEQYQTEQAKRFKVRAPVQLSGGLTGLQNLGNTCFMNSSLQCLIHIVSLSQYMASNNFVTDLNEKNPLGTGGKLACAYAELVKCVWEGQSSSISPWDLKSVIGKYASQFSGYNQQDSQELLSYLLDGLHEDLNRVRKKPYVPEVEYKGQPDELLSTIYWSNHLVRNNSIITDLFTGQYKSQVQCPDCKYMSITFDPFLSISLPIPIKEYLSFSFYMVFADSSQIPLKIQIQQLGTTLLSDIIANVASKKQLDPECFNFYSIHDNSIDRKYDTSMTLKAAKESPSLCFLYQEYVTKPTLQGVYYFIQVDIYEIQQKKNFEHRPSSSKISYTRLFHMSQGATNYDVAEAIYLLIRPYLILYLEYQQQQLPRDLDNIVKNNLGFDAFLKLNPTSIPYSIQEGTQAFIANDMKINSSLKLNLYFFSWLKTEGLRLNRCQDFDIALESQKQTPCTLNECLSSFCQEEILGQGDEWYCKQCKGHKRATKKMDIYRLPQILILHLKRFKSSRVYSYGSHFFQGGSSKICAYVDCPMEIVPKVLSQDKAIYDLIAVSNHFGGLGGGHYTASAKVNNRWFDFNDSQVKEFRGSPISEAAYVLFYQRR